METAEFNQNPQGDILESFKARIENIPSVEQSDRDLLNFYVSNVFYGDPELRTYSLESFIERAGEEKAMELQHKFVAELTERERHQLVERIPKGVKVELEVEKYWNGNSPYATELMRDIVERFGLYALESGEALPDDIENTMKLSDEEAKELMGQEFPVGERIRNTVRGTVQAEPIQGYGGLRLLTEDKEMIGEVTHDVVNFVLTGVDREEAKRRPREIYYDRQVKVLEPYTNTWQEGTIEGILLADSLRVRLANPVPKPTILNIDKRVEFVDIWIGKPSDYEPTVELPEVGTASVENEPWLYETIQFDLEAQSPPLEKVPEVFGPGNLIRFGGEVLEVRRVSSQGMVEVKDINKPPGIRGWDTINWIELDELPQILTDEGLAPEVVEAASNIRGARVKVNTKDLGYTDGEGKDVIIAVKGVYNIDGSPKVLLQALPVWLGRYGNKPEFSYKTLDWSDFNRLQEEGTMEVSAPDITYELREKFPNRFEDILKYLDEDDGTATCNLRLKVGRIDNGNVSFSSLPYGIWNVWEPSGKPELIPLEDIEDIEPYDFWAQF